eukprot:UN4365
MAVSLRLLAAVFAPDGAPQEQALTDFARTCELLFAVGSEASTRATMLHEDPHGFISNMDHELRSQVRISPMDGTTVPALQRLCLDPRHQAEHDQRDVRCAIRAMYRRYLAAREWPRCRVAGQYIAYHSTSA